MPKREEDKLMPDQTDTALTPDELTDRASALNALDKSYALHWLATAPPKRSPL